MSNRRNAKFIQGPSSRSTLNLYEKLEDAIMTECGVQATVKITDELVTIRTTNYRDFVLAMKAIRGRVSQPIEQA